MTIYSGDILTPALLNPPGWTSFTPSWTATTTNPAIGNGTLDGRWRYADDPGMVEIFMTIRPGSTTTFGSGTYRLGLPVDAVSGGPDVMLLGTGLLGSSLYPFIGWASCLGAAASFVTLYRSNPTATENLASWTPTAPVTFANGHTVQFHGMYRVTW